MSKKEVDDQYDHAEEDSTLSSTKRSQAFKVAIKLEGIVSRPEYR